MYAINGKKEYVTVLGSKRNEERVTGFIVMCAHFLFCDCTRFRPEATLRS